VHGEELLAQVRRAFEVGEQVGEEVGWVGPAGVLVVVAEGYLGGSAVLLRLIGAGSLVTVMGIVFIWIGLRLGLNVGEDDDLVDAEDSGGTCDLAGEKSFLVVVLGTEVRVRNLDFLVNGVRLNLLCDDAPW
jgi:hypothetical protein